MFVAIFQEDEANYVENAKNELAGKFYNDLEEELALAALRLDWLGPLLNERKQVPSRPAEPKTEEPTELPRGPAPSGDE
jgi:hypothetical protein